MQLTLRKIMSILLIVLLLPVAAVADDTAEEDDSYYLLDYFDGTELDLTQYEGKAILLNFFTQWCGYCMQEMPDIKEVYETYDPDSLAIILIHPWNGEDSDESAAVVAEYGLEEITLIEDEDMAISNLVGLQGYPTSIFIDQDGYYYGYAYAMDFESFSEVFDAMGVPKREDVEDTQDGQDSSSYSSTDATSQATPRK